MTESSTTPLGDTTDATGPGGPVLAYTALRETARPRTLIDQIATSASLYAMLIPTFLLLALFCLVPFVIAIWRSFQEYEVGGTAKFVGLANYREYLFHDYTFLQSFGNMIFLTLFAVICVMVVPLVVAKLIFSLSSERASYIYRILFLIPIIVPNVAIFLIWRGVIYGDDGLLNLVSRALHLPLPAHGWFSTPSTVLWAIACIGFPFAGGINILIYYAGLTSIPDSVHEAAELDGAIGLRKFFTIDVPMVMSQIKLLVMLTIIGGVQAFEGVYILTDGGPGFRSLVPGLWMYDNAFKFQRMGYACAIGVILFLLILALTIFNMRYFRSAEQLQGQTQ